MVVHYEKGRFCGWLANNGGWSWGNEIVVGFTLGYYKAKSGHSIDERVSRVPLPLDQVRGARAIGKCSQ